MREIININDNWIFTKDGFSCRLNLPHTWNNLDGQGDNNDGMYARMKCSYSKDLAPIEYGRVMLEFEGANSICEVKIDGTTLGVHRGGYSHFRFDITNYIRSGCTVTADVDNNDYADVYPSTADFTFWGGLYRSVNLIVTGDCHFSCRDYSSDGLYVTPFKNGDSRFLGIKALIDNPADGAVIRYTLYDAKGKVYRSAESDINKDTTVIDCGNPNLWNGRKDPYLYTLTAEIVMPDGSVSDNLTVKTGFRDFEIDAQKGAFLNGKHIKLKGLCRHQDRADMGNALTIKEHTEDMDIICETGANALRLAHYQQASEFYDLCDERGILVWAEIPMISRFSPKKHQNAKMQLLELIKQNYNHPSIFCWGIENEITIGGAKPALQACLEELNNIVHTVDTTRYSTCAQVSMLKVDSPLNSITDILGYNHYFGWYMDSCDGLAKWFDRFYAANPDKKLCLSEYGAEAVLRWQTDNPQQGDYTEQYQCLYHEKYLKEINSRDELWGSFLWNTFDFGSCIRSEGGVKGKNNKGLVTYDRKIKKDAFYLYKATWSDEKMLHICGSRFVNRPAGTTSVKVYSNYPEVKLTAGENTYTLKGETVFDFKDVPIALGENVITAKAGKATESITIIGVEEPDESYVLPESQHSFVRNWFNDETQPGTVITLDDSLGDVLESEDTKAIVRTQFGNKLDFVFKAAGPLKRVKLRPALDLAKKVGMPDEYADLAEGYLKTLKKK